MVTQYGKDPHDKAVFLRGIRDIRDNAPTLYNIRGSFRKRGIYPFNPDLVVKPLPDREEGEFIPLRGFDLINSADTRGVPERSTTQERLSPVPSSSSIELPNTPRSLRKSFRKIQPYKTADDEKLYRRIKRIERFTTIEYEEKCPQRRYCLQVQYSANQRHFHQPEQAPNYQIRCHYHQGCKGQNCRAYGAGKTAMGEEGRKGE